MNYTAIDDLLNEMTSDELAEIAGSDGVIAPERIYQAAEGAKALIDSYISERYILQDSPPFDPFIRKLSCDLTIANLFEQSKAHSSLPNTIVWRRLNALRYLQMIKNNDLSLPNSAELNLSFTAVVKTKSVRDFSTEKTHDIF